MSGSPGPVIVWFRRDLRLADNPALTWAMERRAPVIPVYVHDEKLEERHLGGASRWWLHGSLKALSDDLAARGSSLILKSGPVVGALVELAQETGAEALAFNRSHDPAAPDLEAFVVEMLHDLQVRSFNAGWLVEPGNLLTGQGAPYKVFTPFANNMRANLELPALVEAPAHIASPKPSPVSEDLARWNLRPTNPDWAAGFEGQPGEAGARLQLDRFLARGIAAYPTARDAPGDPAGTSRLSAHLRFGEIAPWRVVAEADRSPDKTAAAKFEGELIWRDFAAHLLHHFPTMARDNMREAFNDMAWRNDKPGFDAWRRGQTGFPIVDAGMRQLWTTGWMHNRVRMIVASFLVKDLLIDWRRGEEWFFDTLVDADPANNAMNWQWAAGTGVDAAPYFRVFNPTLQGERFDKDGSYVRRWVPEIARLPDRWIHRPAEAPPEVLQQAGVVLGKDYPAPIVDHAKARLRALETWKAIR